eukprot:Phypoly_transcript_08258.p1 GENE.Phypoly_transcript_08258~~Phypoly_transcript_08258.p1  ORF type:complete len:472 (+),score=118.55 Phypoly_transcript_08258:63-1478(+)
MQDATHDKGNPSQATNGAEPVFAAAKFTLTVKGRKRRDLPTPPTSDPEDDSPKDPSNVRHSKRLANKHMDFTVFKFGNPLSHLQGEERKLLKQFAMEQEEEDEDAPHEEVKKRPRGRPPVHAKKVAASPKPIVTHAKPQARPSLVLRLGNSSDGSGGSTTTSPGSSPPSTPPLSITTSSPQSNINASPPPSSPVPSTPEASSSSSTTNPPSSNTSSTTTPETPSTLNGHAPLQSHTNFSFAHPLLLPKPEPPPSPTNNSETTKATPELNATPSRPNEEESDLDEYGAPQIEESSTPFEAEVKAENPLSSDAIRAHHSLEQPSTNTTNGKAPERVKRKYTKRGTSKVALAKAAAQQKAKAAEAIATAFSINFSQALPYPHNSPHYSPYNPILSPSSTLIPNPSPTPSSTSSSSMVASPPVSSPPSVEQSNPLDLLAIKTEALKMLQQCVVNRLITEEQYKAKQQEFLISISF